MTTLIYGPPCGGKSTLVHELHERGDLVLDFDQVHAALSGLDPYDHHNDITTFVVEAIQDSMDMQSFARVEDVSEDVEDLWAEIDDLSDEIEGVKDSVGLLLMSDEQSWWPDD